MCGIIGFLGDESCFDYGINGLKQLQNRGYDSAGCCGTYNNELIIKKYSQSKECDSIVLLEKQKDNFINCNNGIFHTRWATHGAKTDKNAHPHICNKNMIALVHNGIIENYYELKLELEKYHGIIFKSETDSEVIVNLISIYYEDCKNMEIAIQQTVLKIKGTWALIIINKNEPDAMYCVRHGSSLLIGFSDSYTIVSSEKAGFCNYVNNYICMNNGDLIILKKNNKEITNYKLHYINKNSEDLTPYPYEHWTIKEIYEQYESSIRAINFGGRITENKVNLGGLSLHTEKLKNIKHLLILGCGTSLNASNHSVEFFKELCNFVSVQTFDGSEFTSNDIPQDKKDYICAIFVSQSGETKDLYRCIKICQDNNIFTIGVVNVVDSLIAREVNCGCYLNTGREVGVASTKAFTSQVIVLSMIAIFFAQIQEINQNKIQLYIKYLRQLPEDIKKTISTINEKCEKVAEYLIQHKSLFILGKGSMISIASEGSLKIKEIGYVHSEAYSTNALRHGTYALIEPNTPIIFINPDDNNNIANNNTIEEVNSRNAYVIVISDNEKISRYVKEFIPIPKNKIYKGIIHNIPLQLISYYIAILKGHDPDKPRNLSKCVSV